ncbi:unnamed protein product [Brugia timori]|uniref:Uncharacterized protein n=1 Tax=Brugia timori TaxID=42155 RepID=A0A0R3R8T3_9BILA|nr:unnamed protein product [Brugia timori]
MIPAGIKLVFSICGWILIIVAYVAVLLALPFSACVCVKVIAAEGEKKALESLNEAANMIADSPC